LINRKTNCSERPCSLTRTRFESHPGDKGPYAPRHHGDHYHIELKPHNLSWKQAEKQKLLLKVKPENHDPGQASCRANDTHESDMTKFPVSYGTGPANLIETE